MTPVQNIHDMLHPTPVHIRNIDGRDLRAALADGWADFREKRGDIIIIGFAYPIIGLLLVVLGMGYSLIPVIFPLTAGITILGPAVATGFYELARRRERGLDSSWKHFFDVFSGPSFPAIATLTLVLVLLFLFWLGTAWAIYILSFGDQPPATLGGFLNQLFTTHAGWTLIIGGNIVGFLFAAVTLTISVVSFPMLVDRQVDLFTAVETSVRAMAHNPVRMAQWGLIVAGLLLIGCIPFFIGLAIVLPWLGYSTWHLYTRVVHADKSLRMPAG